MDTHITLFAATGWFVELPTYMQWLLAFWVFAIGACFGSFMNVVIYRVPAGLSIVSPGSRCPKCLHAIRGFDNVPVLSWLVLRGHCRDCGVAIAARYPLVEAIVAIAFVVLAVPDLLWHEPSDAAGSAARAIRFPAWDVWATYAGHLLFVGTLICAALIEYDGHRVPWKLFVPAVAGGVLLAIALSVGKSSALSLPRETLAPLGGLVLGLFALPTAARLDARHAASPPLCLAFALVGWYTDLVFVAAITLLTMVVAVFAHVLRLAPVLPRVPLFGWLTALTTGGLIVAAAAPLGPDRRWLESIRIYLPTASVVLLVILALLVSKWLPEAATTRAASRPAKENGS